MLQYPRGHRPKAFNFFGGKFNLFRQTDPLRPRQEPLRGVLFGWRARVRPEPGWARRVRAGRGHGLLPRQAARHHQHARRGTLQGKIIRGRISAVLFGHRDTGCCHNAKR